MLAVHSRGLDARAREDVGDVAVDGVLGPDGDLPPEPFVVLDEHVRGGLEELEGLGRGARVQRLVEVPEAGRDELFAHRGLEGGEFGGGWFGGRGWDDGCFWLLPSVFLLLVCVSPGTLGVRLLVFWPLVILFRVLGFGRLLLGPFLVVLGFFVDTIPLVILLLFLIVRCTLRRFKCGLALGSLLCLPLSLVQGLLRAIEGGCCWLIFASRPIAIVARLFLLLLLYPGLLVLYELLPELSDILVRYGDLRFAVGPLALLDWH